MAFVFADVMRLRIRRARRSAVSAASGCFLRELHSGGESEFGVDVGEVGLHGAR